jgi:hypothetical protein
MEGMYKRKREKDVNILWKQVIKWENYKEK